MLDDFLGTDKRPAPIPYSYLHRQFDRAAIREIAPAILDIVERGDFTLGAELAKFEAAFAAECAVDHAIGVANGTDALELCLEALGIEGEVITAPFSFFATAASIDRRAGCKVVFADVGPDYLIDPAAIEAAITPRTAAIMPVHWAGRPCDMTAITAIASRNGLAVIGDAAQAIGTRWEGKPVGAWGDAAAFSLHPLKTVNVWGDGGMVTSTYDHTAVRIRHLRNHGISDRNTCLHWGRNSRLDTIQAAVALHELGRIRDRLDARIRNASTLMARLWGIPEVRLPSPLPHGRCTWYLFAIRAERRDDLQAFLAEHKVETKVHYPVPLHLQPAAAHLGHRRGDFPMAEACADETLSLPVHEFVTPNDVVLIANLIRQFYGAPAI